MSCDFVSLYLFICPIFYVYEIELKFFHCVLILFHRNIT